MKFIFCLVFLFLFTVSYSYEKADSSDAKLKTVAVFSLNSNGIASIPAFSLDKPALIASVSLAKNRFNYEPQLAYGLDFKPWTLDNWFHYKIIVRPDFELRAGVDFNEFFSDFKLQDETIRRGQRYFTYELAGIFKFSPHSSLLVAYWNDRGQDKGTLIGHFFNLVGERSDINLGNNISLTSAIQLFYIDYEGNNDGLFIAPKISSSIRNVPVGIFLQAIQALYSNISPFPRFRWNLGLSYTL